ncbi:hypothetical protein ABBQ32_012274 [Trebouxia sp. C0010 RCD-2024]
MHHRHTAMCSRYGPSFLWQTALSIYVLQACQSTAAQTSSSDVHALNAFNNLLLPHAWQTNNRSLLDPCGSRDCGVSACTLYDVAPRQCNWDGDCCLDWKVVGISLLPQKSPTDAALSTVLDAIGSLQNLAVLRLAQQGYTGTLPPEGISSLVSLQALDLSDNQLTGTLPSEGIPSMTGLQLLDLSNNQFTGFLPSSWGSLSRTASVDLSDNNLTGRLPVTWTPGQQTVGSSAGMDVHGNPGICNPRPESNDRPTCNVSMLSQQHAVDPQAGALVSAPPPPDYASYAPDSQGTSGGIGTLLYIPIAVFPTMIGLFCLVFATTRVMRRQALRSTQQQAGCSSPSCPQGPPCLVVGPDGQSLAIATAPASPTSPSRQAYGWFGSAVTQRQNTMYTAYLDVEEPPVMDATSSKT